MRSCANTFLRAKTRTKNDKAHRRFSGAENLRLEGRHVVQQRVLYYGEIRREGVGYLVGKPKGRLSKLESALQGKPGQQTHEDVLVKLHEDEDL